MRITYLITLMLAVSIAGCHQDQTVNPSVTDANVLGIERPDPGLDKNQAQIFKTNVSEEIVLNLSPRLGLLAKSFKGEPVDLSGLFDLKIEYKGLEDFDVIQAVESQPTDQDHLVAHVAWPLNSKFTELPDPSSEIWKPLLNEFKLEDAQFGIVGGELLEDADVFQMKTVFEGRFRDQQNRVFGVKAKQVLDWYPVNNQWRIGNWKQEQFEVVFAPRPLFEDVTENVIEGAEPRKLLANSMHEELMIRRSKSPWLLQEFPPVVQFFIDWNSLFQYTSASVVDLDHDQWDDLFVTDRWGQSLLLRNRGDGTFEDVSRSCGLKLDEAMANCALFADFDNDGDSDVLIGRSLKPSLYYQNDDGKFVIDKEISEELHAVRFVSSGSVIDVNRDGLLDVYLSTYCTRSGAQLDWIEYAVPPYQQNTLGSMMVDSHSFIDRRGPPNVLLMNKGGKLKRVPMDFTLEQWRVSFQSVWTDIDEDGDPDVYLCNDFAPDVFLRNDTKQGSFEPKFTDVTDTVFPGGSMGFGMGASLGDYDSDGALDLYVSNMYSKAGHRVIHQFGGEVDQKIAVSAKGNFLYRNTGGQFEQVAGLEGDQQRVSKVGWSFGGQLADFNNDGKLDVYVPSGFFTAPASIAADVDL